MNKRFKDLYMDIAKRIADMSRATRLHVGAIVVKDDRIISMGYNGMPAGWDNNCENIEFIDFNTVENLSTEQTIERWPFEGKFWVNGKEIDTRYRLVTKPEVLHAEMNCLMKLARSTESGEGAAMFLTHSPCIECAKGIYQAGITSVYYREQYRSKEGLDFLNKCNVKTEQVAE